MATKVAAAPPEKQGGGIFDWIERVGNKVPHPVMMFLYLIIGVIILSHILYLMGVSVTDTVVTAVPKAQLGQLREALGGVEVRVDRLLTSTLARGSAQLLHRCHPTPVARENCLLWHPCALQRFSTTSSGTTVRRTSAASRPRWRLPRPGRAGS